MQRIRLKVLLFLTPLILLLVSSCEQRQAIRIRTTVESSATGSAATANVYLEGSDGNVLTGAVVLVSTADNIVTKLDFDSTAYCYRTKSLPLSKSQEYRFTIQSNAASKIITYTVPHSFISTQPIVNVFEGSSGKSVLKGDKLEATDAIQVAWSPSDGGNVYQITIKDSVQTVYSTATSGTFVRIPADTLASGSYYLEITAQSLYGDPLFQDADFYSASSCKSTKVRFDVT